MFLAALERLLRMRLSRAERMFLAAVVQQDTELRRHQLEGVLSDAWQAYCSFSREVCIESALGATTGSGAVTVTSITPATWERASHIAIRASAGSPINIGTNSILRREPTWGDSAKIGMIIAALAPTNGVQLQANFVGGLTGPKHCQTVRNAAAHKNSDTLAEVKALAPNYVASPITYPTDALQWRDPTAGVFAFISWLDDMRTIAAGAVA